MLIVFGGLPGVGKSTIARGLARRAGAVHLRIDSIEQAIRDSGIAHGSLQDAGYRAAYAVAEDNLRLGRIVIADSVNPIRLTRDAWLDVARRADVCVAEIEIICSNIVEHRHRVESRKGDVLGLNLPTWEEVRSREYERWDREQLIFDSATMSPDESVETIAGLLRLPLKDFQHQLVF